jgi:hypothetical protein
MISSLSPLTSMVFQVLHSMENGASANLGVAILVEGATFSPR